MKSTEWTVLPVIVCNAVDFMVDINGKWNTIKAFIAHTASETARVVWLTHGLQNLTSIEKYQ